MSINRRPIPQTNNHSINTTGVIIDGNNQTLINYTNTTGTLVTNISIGDNQKEYSIVFLIALAFHPMYVPLKQWDKITVIHIDNDESNIHPDNLTWYFKDGVPFDGAARYRVIPGYTQYAINRKGVVVKCSNYRFIQGYKTSSGYVDYKLNNDKDVRVNTGRHRLLCLAWKPWIHKSNDVSTLQVNHDNGIPGSDDLKNLEWSTPTENLQHAYDTGLRSDNVPVLVRNINTGLVTRYNSYRECGDDLGYNDSTIYRWLLIKGQPIYLEELQFKLESDSSSWRTPQSDEITMSVRGGIAVLVKNTITGKVTKYKSSKECAIALKCSHVAVWKRARDSRQLVYPGGLQFKLHTDTTPWRTVITNVPEVKFNRPVKSIHLITGDVIIHKSATACSNKLNLSRTSIRRCLAKPDKTFKGYKFSYNDS